MEVIEMRTHLLGAPRTQAMVRHLLAEPKFVRWAVPSLTGSLQGALSPNLTARAVVGALMLVWSVARNLAPNGRIAGATLADIDRLAGLPCFGRAMLAAGWLREEAGGVVLPNFAEHNPPPGAPPKAAKEPASDPDFEAFWAAYPKKVGKLEALKAWRKHRPGQGLTARILAALEAQKRSAKWQEDKGKFIPHPATWLNAGRWDDEVTPAEDPEARRRKAREHLQQIQSAPPDPAERLKVAELLKGVTRRATQEG
jgi:hypothetical protein